MTIPVPAFTYLGCHLIIIIVIIIVKRLGTIIYSMIHSILWAVVGTMHYVHKYTCHFHYIKIIMVPCVVSISNDNYCFFYL